MLTESQKLICERVINVFETGTIAGKYGAISIYPDGPHGIRQITYGRSQTTEYGNLKELVEMYVEEGGTFSAALAPYVERIGLVALVDNADFKDLLRRAGNEDPAMRSTQDAFFDKRYFQPALNWATNLGFTLPLSILVIYDSFIHSGSILQFLRARFPEKPPASGGDEKAWIRQYVDVRHAWLTTHSNSAVRPSAYRTKDLKREIANNNWDLAILPFMANGTAVDDSDGPSVHSALTMAVPDLVPFLGAGDGVSVVEIWSELEPLVPELAAAAAPSSAASLAQSILDGGRVDLARVHSSGNQDNATAYQNIMDAAAGNAARRSSYGNAPGGTVRLDVDMLRGLVALAETYTFSVSELCGGSHNSNSRHYAGVGIDVNSINGQHVGANHPDVAAFKEMCRDLGATEVLGPGNAGHSTHIHAAWPRP